MNKNIIIFLVVIILLIICVVSFFAIFKEPPVIVNPDPPVVEIKDPVEEIIIETATTKTETQRRSINVNMPKFTNLSNFSFQESINQKISDSINPYINEIIIVADESLPATIKYKYDVEYERYNNEKYISLVVSQNYSTGGMRSNAWKETYTVDFANNREVSLADVCSSNNYKEIIVQEVNKQAQQRNLELVAGNGLSDIPDTQRFYLKNKKLYIYFEPASIAPYLDGEMHFEMPFEYVDGKFIVE